MKKLFSLALIAVCTVSLMGSCKKKGGNEPTPAPTPTPTPITPTPTPSPEPAPTPTPDPGAATDPKTTPIDKSKSLVLKLASGATEFKLAGLTGHEVTLEGASSNGVVASDGNVTEWAYSQKEIKENTFTATAGATITIKGNVRSLTITAGKFESIDLSNAPTTLSGFYFFEQGNSGTISLSSINFGNITTLANLYLGVNPGYNKVGPNS